MSAKGAGNAKERIFSRELLITVIRILRMLFLFLIKLSISKSEQVLLERS